MTSEHVWGDWLKPYVRSALNKSPILQKTVGRIGTPDRDRVVILAGGPLNSQAKVVCGQCNSEWLSDIQNRAKPHMVPLIEGRTTVIGERAQKAIATWATMATITGEYILGRHAFITVSQDHRRAFKDTSAPIAIGWRIWIGHYVRFRWLGHLVHACVPIHFKGDVIIPNVQDRDTPLANTQWTTIIIGNLYVHTASSGDHPDLIKNWRWPNEPRARGLLVQVWPSKESAIVWPPQSLTDRDAQSFATANFRHLRAIARDR
jgi:hypothetical protein